MDDAPASDMPADDGAVPSEGSEGTDTGAEAPAEGGAMPEGDTPAAN